MSLLNKLQNLDPEYRKLQKLQRQQQVQQKEERINSIQQKGKKNKNNALKVAVGSVGVGGIGTVIRQTGEANAVNYEKSWNSLAKNNFLPPGSLAPTKQNHAIIQKQLNNGKLLKTAGAGLLAGAGAYGIYNHLKTKKKLKEARGFNGYYNLSDF